VYQLSSLTRPWNRTDRDRKNQTSGVSALIYRFTVAAAAAMKLTQICLVFINHQAGETLNELATLTA
jgi:hypothetical protein